MLSPGNGVSRMHGACNSPHGTECMPKSPREHKSLAHSNERDPPSRGQNSPTRGALRIYYNKAAQSSGAARAGKVVGTVLDLPKLKLGDSIYF